MNVANSITNLLVSRLVLSLKQGSEHLEIVSANGPYLPALSLARPHIHSHFSPSEMCDLETAFLDHEVAPDEGFLLGPVSGTSMKV